MTRVRTTSIIVPGTAAMFTRKCNRRDAEAQRQTQRRQEVEKHVARRVRFSGPVIATHRPSSDAVPPRTVVAASPFRKRQRSLN